MQLSVLLYYLENLSLQNREVRSVLQTFLLKHGAGNRPNNNIYYKHFTVIALQMQ